MMNDPYPLDTPDAAADEARRAEAFAEQITMLEEDRPPTTMTIAAADEAALAVARRLIVTARPRDPSPTFVADLEQQLLAQFPNAAQAVPRPQRASRRKLVERGLTLAAGLTGGVLLDRATQPPASLPPPVQGPWAMALVGEAGTWLAVATVSQFTVGAVLNFTTPYVAGHIMRRTDGTFKAISAACTHMGCIVAWNGVQQTFDCPCHHGRFDAQGTPLPNQTIAYRPLPMMLTKVEGDTVYVYVPTAPAT